MCDFIFFCLLEGKEWLCLNCQVKRATGGNERSPVLNSSVTKPSPVHPAQPKTSAPGSPQKKMWTPAAQQSKVDVPGQKSPMESRKPGPQSQSAQPNQTTQKQENASAPAQQPGGFFGFGSSKLQPSPAKPADSVTGKMFGLGSSIFSSASTLISTSGQDESKMTPPVSPKMSASKDTKNPDPNKPDQEKKSDQPHAKGTPPTDDKVGKPPPQQLEKASAKRNQSICPLCKLELNTGSKDPPNFNTCTMCKNMVCNQCGFNPMPNVTKVKS